MPILAALFVLGVGALCQFVVVRPMLERAPALSIAAEAELVLWLLISTSAVVAALLSSLALSSQRRPLHDLAAQIGVSGVVGAPTPLALPEVGPAALFQVVTRYNALVEMVLRSSDALRSDAALAHARASSEEELSSLVLSHVPSGILAVDARGRVVRANEAALRILDLTMDALDGEELAGVLGESHPLVEATRHDVLRDEFQVSQGQHPRVLGVSSGILRDAAGQAAGHVLVFADLTDLRHLEQQLQMKERLASLGQVAAGLAHEIRNPLGALRGFIELLERRLDEPERARPLFAKVLREADTLSQVVGDFLAFCPACTAAARDHRCPEPARGGVRGRGHGGRCRGPAHPDPRRRRRARAAGRRGTAAPGPGQFRAQCLPGHGCRGPGEAAGRTPPGGAAPRGRG
ncbi:MAG: histidine kinase dimerization/phospho-acceptor domain-containing protein [Pseudomonadota bacterium]